MKKNQKFYMREHDKMEGAYKANHNFHLQGVEKGPCKSFTTEQS